MTLLRRYWGYALVLILVLLILNGADAALVLAAAAASAGYFFLRAPVWCGAETRGGGLCRNNSRGLLFGCHLRQHKWQVFKVAVVPHSLRQLHDAYWASPAQRLATLGATGTTFAALVALGALILDRG